MISLDLETTGLDPRFHEAWEVALVDTNNDAMTGRGQLAIEFPVRSLESAEAGALQVSGYYQRHRIRPRANYAERFGSGTPTSWPPVQDDPEPRLSPEEAALMIARMTDGEQLLGCAIAFDMAFLAALLQSYGVQPSWHHRSLDLGSYIAGTARAAKPLSSKAMSDRVPNPEAHTALGDALWNVKVYRATQDGEFA